MPRPKRARKPSRAALEAAENAKRVEHAEPESQSSREAPKRAAGLAPTSSGKRARKPVLDVQDPDPEPPRAAALAPTPSGKRARKPSRAALEAAENAKCAEDAQPEARWQSPREAPKRAAGLAPTPSGKRVRKPSQNAKPAPPMRRRVRGKWQPPPSPIAPAPAQLRPVLAFLDHGSVMQLAVTCRDGAAAVYQGHGAATHGQHPAAVAYGEWIGKMPGWGRAQAAQREANVGGRMWLSVTDKPLQWFALQHRGLDLGGIVLCHECGCFQFSGNPCFFCEHGVHPTQTVSKTAAKHLFRLRDEDIWLPGRSSARFSAADLCRMSERRWGSMADALAKKIVAAETKQAKLERVDARLRAQGLDPAEVHAEEAEEKRRNRRRHSWRSPHGYLRDELDEHYWSHGNGVYIPYDDNEHPVIECSVS